MTLKKRRFLLAAQLLCSAAVVVLAVLQLIGAWEKALYAAEPLLGVVLLLNGALNWNRKRAAAAASIVAAVFVWLCAAAVFFL